MQVTGSVRCHPAQIGQTTFVSNLDLALSFVAIHFLQIGQQRFVLQRQNERFDRTSDVAGFETEYAADLGGEPPDVQRFVEKDDAHPGGRQQIVHVRGRFG